MLILSFSVNVGRHHDIHKVHTHKTRTGLRVASIVVCVVRGRCRH